VRMFWLAGYAILSYKRRVGMLIFSKMKGKK